MVHTTNSFLFYMGCGFSFSHTFFIVFFPFSVFCQVDSEIDILNYTRESKLDGGAPDSIRADSAKVEGGWSSRLKGKNLIIFSHLQIDFNAIHGAPQFFTSDTRVVYQTHTAMSSMDIAGVPFNGRVDFRNFETPGVPELQFQFSLDANALARRFEEKAAKKIESLMLVRDSLDREIKASKMQLLREVNSARIAKEKKLLDSRSGAPGSFNDLRPAEASQLQDSIRDSFEIDSSYATSEKVAFEQPDLFESSAMSYEKLALRIDSLELLKAKLENRIDDINSNPLDGRVSFADTAKPYFLKDYLKYTKSFDVGMCNPIRGTFLMNGSLLNGVSYENEKQGIYTSFSAGKMRRFGHGFASPAAGSDMEYGSLLNALGQQAFDTRIIQAQIGKVNASSRGIKLGYLKASTEGSPGSSTASEKHILSLDVDLLVLDKISVGGSFARSFGQNPLISVMRQEENEGDYAKASSALAGNIKVPLWQDKTVLDGSIRWVQANFDNPALAFVRTDNVLYNLRITQKLPFRMDLTAFTSKAVDGALLTPGMETEISRMGFGLGKRIGKNLNMRSNYSQIRGLSSYILPVLLSEEDEVVQSETLSNNSFSFSQDLSWGKRIGNSHLSANVHGSYFEMSFVGSTSYVNVMSSSLQIFSPNADFSLSLTRQAEASNSDFFSTGPRMISDLSYKRRWEYLFGEAGVSSLHLLEAEASIGYKAAFGYQARRVTCQIKYERLVEDFFFQALNDAGIDMMQQRLSLSFNFILI